MGTNLMSLVNRTGGGYLKMGYGSTMIKTEPTIPYQRIAYIENRNGYSEIHFGGNYAQGGHNLKQYCKFAMTSLGERDVICGANNALYMAESAVIRGYWGAFWGDGTCDIPATTDWIELTQSCNGASPAVWTLKSEDVAEYSVTGNENYITANIGLFCYGLADGTYQAQDTVAKIAEYKFWYDNVLAIDAVAVRDGDVGGMYDMVSRQFFGQANPGGGAFLLGPDIN